MNRSASSIIYVVKIVYNLVIYMCSSFIRLYTKLNFGSKYASKILEFNS